MMPGDGVFMLLAPQAAMMVVVLDVAAHEPRPGSRSVSYRLVDTVGIPAAHHDRVGARAGAAPARPSGESCTCPRPRRASSYNHVRPPSDDTSTLATPQSPPIATRRP